MIIQFIGHLDQGRQPLFFSRELPQCARNLSKPIMSKNIWCYLKFYDFNCHWIM